MAQQQLLIGGNLAPEHNENLVAELNQTGSVLGQSLELEDALAARLVRNLTHRDENILNLEHSIGFANSHAADGERFEKTLSRMLIPTIASVRIEDDAVETQFNATPQHRVPFVGEVIKNDPTNANNKFICTGHKYVLSSATPTQIINVCVNCPWDVMRRCVYFHGGRYWNITNIKELLSVILKAKVTLFNNNQVTKYKQQHREQFMFMNRRNQRNMNNGMTIFVTKVVMNLSFSSPATTVMDIRETRNQIGRLGWTVADERNDDNVKVHSIVAKQTPAGVLIEDYSHQSYESNIAAINDDPAIVNRTDFEFSSLITIDYRGRIADQGDVEKYYLVATNLTNFGNTANANCLFPAQARNACNAQRNIPRDVLQLDGIWQTANTAITAVQLKLMFSTLQVKVMANQPVTIN